MFTTIKIINIIKVDAVQLIRDPYNIQLSICYVSIASPNMRRKECDLS